MTRSRKETRDEAIARAHAATADAFANRMVACALLRGDPPEVDVTGSDGTRVRAWGLERADGGYLAIEEYNGGAPLYASIVYADAWASEVSKHDPWIHRHDPEIMRRAEWFRDVVAPALRRFLREGRPVCDRS